ncbi:MAG: S8 family serine peptidase, partial [Ktedonobacterales bacterium]
MQRKLRTAILGVVSIAAIVAVVAMMAWPRQTRADSGTTLGSVNPNTDAPYAGSDVDTGSAIVQLKGDPLATYVKTKPAQGKKIDFNNSNVKSYRAQLSAQRNDFKQWLQANAPKANVTGQFDISLNAVSVRLNGVSLDTLRGAPMVQGVDYEGYYHPSSDATADPDLGLINAFAAWDNTTNPMAGSGVKVAVIDTGIDLTHPCFSDAGYPAQNHIGDPSFTNNKVIAAKVFNNNTPSAHYTAEALQEHGTHVAGTIACNFDTSVSIDGVSVPHGISGVAPRALLGSYNVFPGDVTNARSEDILNAMEAAYQDGFDIENMSLGGTYHGVLDLDSKAVDDLDQAGMVVAVAAGNSGPGHFTTESPGRAARALTAGAATVGHALMTPVTVGGHTFGAVAGSFPTVSSDLTAPLAVVTGSGVNGLNNACATSDLPVGSLTGKIALITRGVCAFSVKIRNAQAAGAVAVLMGNSVAGDPIAMGTDGTPNQPTIPAYMVTRSDAGALMAFNGQLTTIGAGQVYTLTGNNDIMAGFSSQGPTLVDFRAKPDVVAPGVNVLSSIPHQFCATPPCFAFFQGTSMATPHLAGSAAVVEWAHPDWSAAQVRSAIVNTADQGTLKRSSGSGLETDVLVTGAGRENLGHAVNATVTLDPVSINFNSIPSNSGENRSRSVTLTNVSSSAQTLTLSLTGGDSGVTYALSQTSVTLAAGESTTLNITMSVNAGAA